jgi:hypothetical protein
MKYSDLKLKVKKDVNIAKLDNKEIEVLKYLPIEDKIDLIQISLQKAEENRIFNEMKLDMYFNLYLVYMYSNLEFTDEEKEDEIKLFNELDSNDVIAAVIDAMDETEYNGLLHYMDVMRASKEKYNRSTAALLQTMIQNLPENAAAAAEIVDNFDKEKYKNVIDFARSANGNRPI